jgi:PAS domain S-box-containing protein
MAERVQLSDLVGDAVIGSDEQHRIVYWNRAATELFGWTADEAEGQPAFALLRITFPDAAVDSVLQTLAASGRWKGQAIYFTKDGRGLVCESNVERLSGTAWRAIRQLVVVRDISERVRLEEVGRRLTEELRQSEARERTGHERFKSLIDSAMDGVVTTDEHNNIILINSAAERMFGVSAADVVGKPHDALIPDRHRAQHRAEMHRFAGEGTTNRLMGGARAVVSGRRANGEEFPAEISISRTGEAGHQMLTAIIRDVTAREQAARSLASALAFNETLLDAAPVGILTYRLTGECRGCNAEAARIFGTTSDDLKQQNFRSLESWQRSGLLRLVDHAIATRHTQSADMAIQTAIGKLTQVIARATVIPSPDGDVLLLVLADVTELKRTERDLRILTRAIEQSESSVVITNRSGQIEYVNPTLLATSGYRRDELIGQNPRVLKSGLTSGEVYRDLWATITTGRTWHGELQNRKKTGEIYWERAVISPVTNEHAEITQFVAVKENITAQKEAEAAAHDAEGRFEQAQKMEAVGRLAGGISHDFNNLLTAILGYAEFALGEPGVAPQMREDIQEIRKAGERAARLTRQLLAFSRKQRVEPQVLDLNQIASELTKMIGRLLGEDVRLTLELATSPGRVRMDPSHLEQVLMNLAVNARDAMPRGGQLTIATADVELDHAFASTHEGVIPGPYVAVRVIDTGSGIPADVLARIFEPFFTTKGVGKGTGLGLSTVYGIVRQSGGCIDVQSTIGQGTVMSVYFPRVDQPLSADRPPAAADAPRRGTESVLVVEDDDSLRVLMERILQARGYHVVSASDGDQAIAVDARVVGPIDLLLSDVVMPGLSGPDLAQRLVRRRPLMKVLYVSGFTHNMATASGITSHHARFLEKPFTPDALAAKVREMLDDASTPPDVVPAA